MEGSLDGVSTCVILGLSFLVGAPGNLLVIWTILRHVKQRSHTVVLILHLAVADLLVLITLPLWIYSLACSWVFGATSCKVMVYIINVCMYSSVFLITLMSVERFVGVRYPFVMLWTTKAVMDRALVVIWLLAFLLGTPAIVIQSIDNIDGTEQCLYKDYSTISQLSCLCLEITFGFVAPFTVLSVCSCIVAGQLRIMQNIKQNINSTSSSASNLHKSIILISSVVVAFILCWLPHHIINIINLVHLARGSDDAVPQSGIFISGALAFISSSVNPALYAFAASMLQEGLCKFPLVKLFQGVSSPTDQLGVTDYTELHGLRLRGKTTNKTDV